MDDKCEPIRVALESSPWRTGEQVQVSSCRIFEIDLDGNRLAQLLAWCQIDGRSSNTALSRVIWKKCSWFMSELVNDW